MRPEPLRKVGAIRAAGDYVEVIDPTSKLHRRVGTVAFFVADNVYVTFRDIRWSPTKMFFPDQLRPAPAPDRIAPAPAAAVLLRKLRISLGKMRS